MHANLAPSEINALDDSAVIEYILERFHRRHRQQFTSLIALADRVEQVHADSQECPTGLREQLQRMKNELEQHMFKEENILFPMIKSGQGGAAMGPIGVMRYEHEDHHKEIEVLENCARGLALPEDACGTWRQLYEELGTFIEDLKAHIDLENDVLFARQQ